MSKIVVDQIQKTGGTALTVPSADGSAGQFLKTDGSAALSFATVSTTNDSGLKSMQVITSTGSWTRPSGITLVHVCIVGGGGGGGCGAGAGAGGYSEKIIDVSSISSSTVTIGAAGAGTTGQPGGNTGGNSSWADGTNTMTANGGLAPTSNSTAYKGGVGGVATGGTLNVVGGDSDPHHDSSYIEQIGSTGGASFFGGGGAGGSSGTGLTEGNAARAYGAGGGGAQSSGTPTGGDGMGGVCIVYEFNS